MREPPTYMASFDTTEGTAMNVDVSPDGDTVVFDLLGDIYVLPLTGGEAVALTHGSAWDQAPRFSLDGQSIYFVSDRVGHKNLWQITLSDRTLRPVTRSETDIMGAPNWSLGGDRLLAGAHSDESQADIFLYSIDPNDGSMTPVVVAEGRLVDWSTFEFLGLLTITLTAAESADGEVYFSRPDLSSSNNLVRIHKFNRHSQARSVLTEVDATYSEYKPQLSRGGTLLAYFRQYKDGRTEIRIRNRNTGQDGAITEFSGTNDAFYVFNEEAQPNYAFTPDDEYLVFSHGGKIHRLKLADGSSEVIPFHAKVEREVATRVKPTVQRLSEEEGEAKIVRWPSLSRDGQTMVFVAVGYAWLMDVETGAVRRLTESSGFEYMPTISPDGISVALVSFAHSDDARGRLRIVDIETGEERDVLAESNATYLLPQWSQDGSMLALIREIKTDVGKEAAFGWIASTGGEFHEVASTEPMDYRDPASTAIYARSVGFDETNRNLLFSYQQVEADTYPLSRAKTVLASAGLDGQNQKTLAVSTSDIGGISPSPDLSKLALTRDDGTAWVVPFSAGEEPVEVSTAVSSARRLSDEDAYYLNWDQSDRITYGFGQDVYRYWLDNDKLERLHVRVAFEIPKSEQPVAFTGARLITMAEGGELPTIIESGTIVLDGRRIVAVGLADAIVVPSGTVIVDASDKTIIPGLLDTHYHRIAGRPLNEFMLPRPNFSERSAIEYGVTTAWEPGSLPNDSVPAVVDLRMAGRILGPRWSYAGAAAGYPRELFTNYAAGLATARQYRELGVTVLKEYGISTRQQRQWLSAAARELGLGIVSHIDSFDRMMTRIVDGYTGGDHPHIPVPFFKDVRELLRQTGFIWTPNAVIASGSLGTGRGLEYFCLALSRRADDGGSPVVGEIDRICPANRIAPAGWPYDINRFARVAEQVALAAVNGAQIGVSAHGLPGWRLHAEMWVLWKGGMPIENVLRAATMTNAEKLGLQEEIGSLEVGKMADFLVLDENPLDDILNTLSLKYTVQGGAIYDSATAERVDVSKFAEAANDVHAMQDRAGTNN